jgi:hypothetical protein
VDFNSDPDLKSAIEACQRHAFAFAVNHLNVCVGWRAGDRTERARSVAHFFRLGFFARTIRSVILIAIARASTGIL